MKQKITRHHRKPKSCGGKNDKRNISLVPEAQHRAYHTLFGNKSVVEIMHELNKVWIDPDYEFILRQKPGTNPNQLVLFPNRKTPD